MGSHEPKNSKKYFSPELKKELVYIYTGKDSDNAIDLAFNKNKIEERKKWLMNYNRNDTLDYNI